MHLRRASYLQHWTTLDRDDWADEPRAPWRDEPDAIAFIDTSTGLRCAARRVRYGSWAGYVGVPPSHPLHGRDYDELNRWSVPAHGELTFSARSSHPRMHPLNLHPDLWWFGFSCNEENDRGPTGPTQGTYRILSYVHEMILGLASALEALRHVDRHRLALTADVLDNVPPREFDLGVWRYTQDDNHYCGFVGCAIGHATADKRHNALGLSYSVHRRAPVYNGRTGWHAVEAFYALPDFLAHNLFSRQSYPYNSRPRPADVADRIRALLNFVGGNK